MLLLLNLREIAFGLGGICKPFQRHLKKGEKQKLCTCNLTQHSLLNYIVHFPKSRHVFNLVILKATEMLKPFA